MQPPIGGFTFPEDPGADYIRAAPMWRADVDPRVLSVSVEAGGTSRAVDIERFAPRILSDAVGQHVRLVVHGEVFRLDVVAGSISSGPVCLTYLLARDQRMGAQMDCILRLERKLAGRSCTAIAKTSRIGRATLALRARDARMAGASLRDMAIELLGPGEGSGPCECC